MPTYVRAVSQSYQCLFRVSYAHLRAHLSCCVPSCLSICMADCVECALHVTAYVINTRTIDDRRPRLGATLGAVRRCFMLPRLG